MPRFTPHPVRRPAIVTGASSGIGRQAAITLAEAGHPVVLGARRVERCEETAAAIREKGGEAVAAPLDLLDASSIDAFVEAAESEFGEIEILISNAGDVAPITTVGAEPAEFARQLGVNLLGAQALVHRVVPAMFERRRGDVVFVTSEVALNPRTHMAGYVASKAGLENLALAMAMECEGTGVRVGIVRPGPSNTEQGTTWSEDAVNEVVASWQQWGLLRHNGSLLPANLAEAILAMVSAPKGARWAVLEVQPEAPIVEAPDDEPLDSDADGGDMNKGGQP